MLNYRHNVESSDETSFYPGIVRLDSDERDNYPLSLSVEDYGSSLGLTVGAVQPVNPDRICGYMQQALQSLADALEYSPDTNVQTLEVIPTEERHLLLETWNATKEDYPKHLCIHSIFEQHVESTPDATALVSEDQSLTYSQLNDSSNQLAHHLIGLGVGPDMRVAICMERSPAMIIGILGILKAGGAYVPLDPTYASERLRHIFADSEPSTVVVDEAGKSVLGEILSSVRVVDLSSISRPDGWKR
jgi:non-ribosomal peptide synthetase component F